MRPGGPGAALESLVLVGVARQALDKIVGSPFILSNRHLNAYVSSISSKEIPLVPHFVPRGPMPAGESKQCLDRLAADGQPERARRVPGPALARSLSPSTRGASRTCGRLGRGGADVPPDARGVAAAARPSATSAPRSCGAPSRSRRSVVWRSCTSALSGDAVNGPAPPEPPAEEAGEILEEAAAPPHAQQASRGPGALPRAAFHPVDDSEHWGEFRLIRQGEKVKSKSQYD
ncbi:hypothetical protein DL771_005541 [Monosporascus sp. 5C6A]|nr:hypothetical protein DL771_005541 [Monosporascus sp. 5C6A]